MTMVTSAPISPTPLNVGFDVETILSSVNPFSSTSNPEKDWFWLSTTILFNSRFNVLPASSLTTAETV